MHLCIMCQLVKLAQLKVVRERRALTQQQLAERAGINRVTIARLEGGHDQPFPTTVRKLADALGVEPAELMVLPHGRDGEQPPAATGRLAPGLVVGSNGPPVAVDAPAEDRFLREHPELAALVTAAADHLERLVPDARLRLTVLTDPDYGDNEQLFLGVSTSLPDSEAIEALRRFDREWWVHQAHRAGGLLCIDLAEE